MEKRSSRPVILSLVAVVAVVVVVVVVVVANNGKGNSPGSAMQTSAAKEQVSNNWKTLFAYSTSMTEREKLLQNGNQFANLVHTEFAALGSHKSSAVVRNVSLNNSTTATVEYNVDLNGQPVLTNQQGKALLINGTWQVSDATFCQLLGMDGSHPAACHNYER